MSNINQDFDFSGVAQIFREVQELEDKAEKTEAEKTRLENLKKVEKLALDGVEIANEIMPVMRKLLKSM